jgi:hypothetical protein
MSNEYHKNLTNTLEKHKLIYDEVVQSSFSSKGEPKLLLAAMDKSYNSEGESNLSSGHHLLHVWFCHRFEEQHVRDGIGMDAIVFEFLKEDVFESEEAARSFFEALDTDHNGSLSFREIMDGALSNSYAERYYLEKFITKLRRRNSLRKSLSKHYMEDEEEEEEGEAEEGEAGQYDDDDIHHIHEAFLQFYFKDVMADNLFLDNLVKAVPHLGEWSMCVRCGLALDALFPHSHHLPPFFHDSCVIDVLQCNVCIAPVSGNNMVHSLLAHRRRRPSSCHV